MEQWREVKAVEFWQPANDNIGAVSVVLDVMYKLRGAHSCRAVLECFKDWGALDTTILFPGKSPKQPLPGIGLHDPYMVGKLAPNLTHFTRELVK